MKKKFDLWGFPHLTPKKLITELKIAIFLLMAGISYALTTPAYATDPLEAESQQQIVRGTVTDSQTGESMAGVNIQVKGTTVGAISDAGGRYSISVPDPNATLVFSFVGYIIQEVPLDGRTSLNISLVTELRGLEEVVVIGYGTMKKSNVSGAITSVKGQELRTVPTSNVAQALQGKAPIYISRNEGQPGSESTIVLRGVGSLRNSNPLWVVDGVKNAPLENVNDIESIQILKDAASTAIYGVEGANGVILVTTNKAKAGKARVNYNVYLKSLHVKMPYIC